MFGDSGGGREVLRGLAIFTVDEDGEDLSVSVYGSEQCVCGSVRFSFPRAVERQARLDLLRSWERAGTAITYVAEGGNVTLVDERDEGAKAWLAELLD